MSRVKFFTSSSWQNLEYKLFSELLSYQNNNPFHPQWVVVGSQSLAHHLQKQWLSRNGWSLNLNFLTLTHFAQRLYFTQQRPSDSLILAQGFPPRRWWIRHLKRLAIGRSTYEIANRGDKESTISTNPLTSPQFWLALEGLFSDLEEAGLRGDPDLEMVDKIINGNFKRRWELLQKIWEHYIQLTSNPKAPLDLSYPFTPPPQEIKTTLERIFSTLTYHFYGFYDFNAIQETFITQLIKAGAGIYFYLPFNPAEYKQEIPTGVGIDDYVAVRTKRWNKNWGGEFERADDGENSTGRQWPAYLFDYHNLPERSGSSEKLPVSIWQANDPFQEIEAVVREVRSLIGQQDPPKTIGIVLTQPQLYRPLLESELKEAGIPFSSDISPTLIESAPVRYILGLLKLSPHQLNAEKLFTLMAQCCPPIETTEKTSPGSYDPNWVKIARERYISVGDQNYWREKLERRDKSQEVQEDTSLSSLGSFINKLFGILSEFQKVSSWNSFVELINSAGNDFLNPSEETDQFKDLLSSLYVPGEYDFRMNGPEALFLLEQILKEVALNRAEGREEDYPIRITTLTMGRGLTFHYLFLLGATHSWLPSYQKTEGILPDQVRKHFNKLVKGDSSHFPLHLQSDKLVEDRLLFQLLCTSAKDHLYFTYPQKGFKGEPFLPSRFVLEVARVLRGEPISADALSFELPDHFTDLSEIGNSEEDKPFRYWREDQLLKSWAGTDWEKLKAVHTYLGQKYPHYNRSHSSVIATSQVAEGNRSLTPYDGVIKDCAPLTLETLSVSELITWIKCPMMHYFQNILHLEAPPEPTSLYELESIIRGKIVHQTLALWVRDQRVLELVGNRYKCRNESGSDAVPPTRDQSEIESKAKSLLIEHFKNTYPSFQHTSFLPRPFWDLAMEVLNQKLQEWFKYIWNQLIETPVLHISTEDSMEASLKYQSIPQSLLLTARFDRWDLICHKEPFIRIVDYKVKTSKSNNKLTLEESIQLLFYLRIFTQNLNSSSSEQFLSSLQDRLAAGGIEASLEQLKSLPIEAHIVRLPLVGPLRTFNPTVREHLELFSSLEAYIIEGLFHSYEKGLFLPIPLPKDSDYVCQNCSYAQMCPEDRRILYTDDTTTQKADNIIEERLQIINELINFLKTKKEDAST